jgi:hypothetical protein
MLRSIDSVAVGLDFQVGWDLPVPIMKGGQSDATVLQSGSADAGFDQTIGNRFQVVLDGDVHVLHLQTTTVSAVKLPSGFGPPTSVTLYPIFKSDSDVEPAEVLIVA